MAEMNSTKHAPNFKDLTGQTFWRWTVLEFHSTKGGHSLWLCRCECGVEKPVEGMSLRKGKSRSCLSCAMTTHGHCDTPTYNIWKGMFTRCRSHNRYKGRGITVCDNWRSFENFFEDMGPKPMPKHTIERIDNDGNYEPDNCCWATRREQARNTCRNHMLTHDGKTMCVSAWAEEIGISPSTLHRRLSRGWSPERALTTPVKS